MEKLDGGDDDGQESSLVEDAIESPSCAQESVELYEEGGETEYGLEHLESHNKIQSDQDESIEEDDDEEDDEDYEVQEEEEDDESQSQQQMV